MVIQNQFSTTILQKFNPIKYHNCLTYDDYILQTWGRSDMKDEGAGEVRRIASEAKHGKLVTSVEYDEDYILDT